MFDQQHGTIGNFSEMTDIVCPHTGLSTKPIFDAIMPGYNCLLVRKPERIKIKYWGILKSE